MMIPVSIVGCGYTGLRLAQRYLNLRHPVRGFATRPDSLRQIAAVGAEAKPLNLDAQPALMDFAGHLVYYAVPPEPSGDRDLRLERLLDHIDGKPRRFIYFSTTGVYGDQGGALVNEDTPAAPETQRALRRLAGENTVRAWADSHAVPWCILRIPAIYGPDRLPLERLRRGEPAIDPRESTPGNRIHVEDLVTACIAAGSSPRADGRIYNVTDGSEDSATAYLQRVARIGSLSPPPFISRAEAERTWSPTTWSYVRESRRVDNRRMLDELCIELAFQDLDSGIQASL